LRKRLKITVTSAEGEPSFTVDEGTTTKEIEKQIKEKYGVIKPKKKGQAFVKHNWISQRATPEDHLNFLLNKQLSELEEKLWEEKEKNKNLKKVIKDLMQCLIQAHTRICYIDRTQEFDWIENHPEKIDITNGKKKAEEILIRFKLNQIDMEEEPPS
jgi:hypothetical protein